MGGGRTGAYTDWHNGPADAEGQRPLENHNSCKYCMVEFEQTCRFGELRPAVNSNL